jgi:hypothetical protein
MSVKINDKEYIVRNLQVKDIPSVSRILKKMELTQIDLKGLFSDGEDSQQILGVRLMMFVFSHIGDAESELYKLLGDLIGMTPKQVSELEMDDFANVIDEIKKQDGLTGFFRLVSKVMQ